MLLVAITLYDIMMLEILKPDTILFWVRVFKFFNSIFSVNLVGLIK